MDLIERIKQKTVQVRKCWEWQGAFQKRGRTPVMRVDDKVFGVRRLIAQHLGLDLREGLLATCRCRNWACVNPDHIQTVTRKVLQRRIGKKVNFRLNLLQKKKLSERMRKRGKLNEQIAKEIRECTEPLEEIAQRYGVSRFTVRAIQRGEAWRDYSNPFVQLIEGFGK